MDSGTMWRRPVGAALVGSVLVLFTTPAWAQLGGTQSEQGTHLNGTVGDRYERIGIPLDSASYKGYGIQAWNDKGQLMGQSGDMLLKGSQLLDVSFSTTVKGLPVKFSFKEARPHVNVYTGVESKTAWEYVVRWESPNGSGNLCPGGMPALALPGRWNGNIFVPSDKPAMFSFACVPIKRKNTDGTYRYDKGGVAAKCVDWGYPPWQSDDPVLGNDTFKSLSLEDWQRHHASCAAMASADYCGESRPNTVDGTPIVMFNTQNVKEEPSQPKYVAWGPFGSGGKFFFEAAWTTVPVIDTSSAVYGLRPKALCLSKKRWSTLPLKGACLNDPSFVPDPRENREVSFCEDLTLEQLLARGATLFSYSTYIDAGLYRFWNQSTNTYLTTASVLIDPAKPYSVRPDIAGADGYVLDPTLARPVYEGPIFSTNAPASSPGLKHTRPLWRYRANEGTARFVTLVEGAEVPDGFVLDDLEGYVYVGMPPAGGAPSLRLWQMGSGFMTTGGDMAAQGYLNLSGAVPMGYLPSMNTYSQLP